MVKDGDKTEGNPLFISETSCLHLYKWRCIKSTWFRRCLGEEMFGVFLKGVWIVECVFFVWLGWGSECEMWFLSFVNAGFFEFADDFYSHGLGEYEVVVTSELRSYTEFRRSKYIDRDSDKERVEFTCCDVGELHGLSSRDRVEKVYPFHTGRGVKRNRCNCCYAHVTQLRYWCF